MIPERVAAMAKPPYIQGETVVRVGSSNPNTVTATFLARGWAHQVPTLDSGANLGRCSIARCESVGIVDSPPTLDLSRLLRVIGDPLTVTFGSYLWMALVPSLSRSASLDRIFPVVRSRFCLGLRLLLRTLGVALPAFDVSTCSAIRSPLTASLLGKFLNRLDHATTGTLTLHPEPPTRGAQPSAVCTGARALLHQFYHPTRSRRDG
jgi:hypothetical protein